VIHGGTGEKAGRFSLRFQEFFLSRRVRETSFFWRSGNNESMGHLLDGVGTKPKQLGAVVGLMGFEHGVESQRNADLRL
jgi:hypothetical protein